MAERYFVECPFFKKAEALWIKCEGVDDRTRLSLMFFTKKEKADYMDGFCKDINRYCNCRISKMLMSKYEGDE